MTPDPGYITAVLDANVLYAAAIRDFFMWIAADDVFAARWTERIQEEWMRNLLTKRPELERACLQRTQDLMNENVDECPVTGYEQHLDVVNLPDPNDHHVLAAAIECDAGYIVTFNLKDFPGTATQAYGIQAIEPDDFCELLMKDQPQAVIQAAEQHRQSLSRPAKTPDEYLSTLEQQGLKRTAHVLANYL